MLPAVASAQVPAVDAESEAEAALKALGANISRNDDGEVWSVVLDYGRQVSGFGDNDVVHLTKLNWAEGVPGDHDWPEIHGVVPSHPAPFLILVDTKLTDAGIEQMKALTQIRYFNLNGNKGITDAGLASFVKSHKIVEELLLMGTSISDDGLEHLKALPKLHGLRVGTIGTTKVTNAGLENLKALNNLTRLGLTGSGVTDAGLMQLKERIGLKVLLLKGTKISNAGLGNLKGMVGRRSLVIGDTEITDAGLVHLKDLTKLEKLVLRGS